MANKMGFMPNRWDLPTKVVFNNNYFGDNPGIYNLFELNCAVKDGSSFSGNTFTKGAASHNFINLYQLDDNATINIDNNSFDCGPDTNPIRIAAKDIIDPDTGERRGPKNVVVNIRNNTYSGDIQYPDWAGILFFQPYAKGTSDFSGITVNISNTTTTNTAEGADGAEISQLLYYYAGPKDAQLLDAEGTKMPHVFIDGVEQDFKSFVEASTLARELPEPEPVVETPTNEPTTGDTTTDPEVTPLS